jgi:hypothetical protein
MCVPAGRWLRCELFYDGSHTHGVPGRSGVHIPYPVLLEFDSSVKPGMQATAYAPGASVEKMNHNVHSCPRFLAPFFAMVRYGIPIAGPLLAILLFLPRATALQLSPATSPPTPVSTVNDSLRPALIQVGSSLDQVQIDHWKVSHEMKGQLHNDVSSIHQDLSSQLPALLHSAQQSPDALAPQLAVMHNVDALYDVLVRIATAAMISGGKNDAGTLDSAVRQLESARKLAASQLMQIATTQDQQIARFHAGIQAAQAAETSPGNRPKTIIVDNSFRHRKKYPKTVPRKKTAPKTPVAVTPAPSGP